MVVAFSYAVPYQRVVGGMMDIRFLGSGVLPYFLNILKSLGYGYLVQVD
jgi:hypothetical protein